MLPLALCNESSNNCLKPHLIASITLLPSADHPTDARPTKHKPTQPLRQHPPTQPQIPPCPLSTVPFPHFHALRIQASITVAGEVFRRLTLGEEEVDEEGDEGAAEEVVCKAGKRLEIEDGGGDAKEEGGEGSEGGEDLGGGREERVSRVPVFWFGEGEGRGG